MAEYFVNPKVRVIYSNGKFTIKVGEESADLTLLEARMLIFALIDPIFTKKPEEKEKKEKEEDKDKTQKRNQKLLEILKDEEKLKELERQADEIIAKIVKDLLVALHSENSEE